MNKMSSILQRNRIVLDVREAVDAILAKHLELNECITGDVDPTTYCKLNGAIEDLGAAIQTIIELNK